MRIKIEKYLIPSGELGSRRTLNIMRKLVNESLLDSYVIQASRNIVSGCGSGKDTFCLADTINRWIKDHSHFLKDPVGVELIHTPKFLLQKIAKNFYYNFDCDDMAVLAASLGKAVGLPAKFVGLGFIKKNAPLTHVYTILKIKNVPLSPFGGWYPIDLKSQYSFSKSLITRKEYFPV